MIAGRVANAVALHLVAVGAWLVPAAAASVPLAPCDPAPLICGTVTVPLDRSGALPDTIDLAVRRKPATSGTSAGVLVTLSGGPGSSAIADLSAYVERLAAAHLTRDLVAFDVRGVGLSSAVSCGSVASFDATLRCAEALGPRRAFFRSRDTADDLEAVRVALGAERVALYAVSYGAVAAYDYASRYPSRVEWMILDSPVAPEGFDPTMKERVALRRVLASICAGRLCPGGMKPARDAAALAARARRGPLVGRFVRPNGRVEPYEMAPFHLYSALVSESDLNTPMRALIPAALRGGVAGDLAPLARLTALVFRRAAVVRGASAADGDLNSAVNRATNCEDARLPWARETPPRITPWGDDPRDSEPRAAAVAAAVRQVPAATYAPFTGLEVVSSRESLAGTCMGWPHSPRPLDTLGAAPAPDIPVLLLSGEHDLRTPRESAEKIAARFPRSQLVLAGYTGHGVIGSAPRAVRPCVVAALGRFVSGVPAEATCRGATRLPPAPSAPTNLARLAPYPGLAGTPGRTLRALFLTLDDVKYSWAAAVSLDGGSTVALGGLRGGRISGTLRRLNLSRVVYVPGVVVSGVYNVGAGTATLSVAGSGSRGTLRLTAGRAAGRLEGRMFSLPRPARPTPLN